MPYVWGNIDTFYKLMQLLPEDALSTTYDDRFAPFTLKRRLNDSDWARFLTHSNYTRKLCVLLAPETFKDYLQLLPHLPSTPLLPNLESVELEISRVSEPLNLDLMALFLPRTLSEVQIRIIEKSADWSVVRVIQMLTKEIELPHLKSFSIHGENYSAYHLKESASKFLQSQQNLQAVNLDVGSGPEIFEILYSTGQLLHLRHLSLQTTQVYSHFEHPPRLLFPELETLKMEGPPFFIHAVVDCVGSGNMQTVKLLVDDDGLGEDNEAEYAIHLTSCLVSIGRFVRLKTLDLESGMPVPTNLLDHVLTCENLESLRLVGAELDPLETEESRRTRMTVAWPRLTTLELQPPATFEESSSAASSY
ncbi:hypothetical protein M407DRAFT_24272 [Tulasnella calospora MUT 4182]|uniref:F-box domain-containing protein n=1 Tax=Tulasnella calospora MUT 4182 TaxID=1051891 RepID=A0A0C3KYI0_9AGAM|nr:hypothetical protein M407DRAFT_24272 [Tulasnella calospora MUT 4182]